MKIIVIRVGNVLHPMTLSIINILQGMGIEVVLCTTKSGIDLNRKFDNRVTVEELDIDYLKRTNVIKKFIRMFIVRKKLWKVIDTHYDEDTILWISHNISIKHLGRKILRKRYILHLNELNEGIIYYPRLPFLRMNSKAIGNGALKVVVPEYNRAHITKAWWNLGRLPVVMENKPYLEKGISRKSPVLHSEEAYTILERLAGRKIILYQGAIQAERPLHGFIKAVERLGNEYAFVIMGSGDNKCIEMGYKNCYYIPYVEPPYHLEITSHAHIGIMSYVPIRNQNSLLNALYCAPTKVFEYGMFGIPMLSNDVPALKYLFDTRHCGICVGSFDDAEIYNAIKTIEDNYDEYATNAKKYSDSVNTEETLRKIVGDVARSLV